MLVCTVLLTLRNSLGAPHSQYSSLEGSNIPLFLLFSDLSVKFHKQKGISYLCVPSIPEFLTEFSEIQAVLPGGTDSSRLTELSKAPTCSLL